MNNLFKELRVKKCKVITFTKNYSSINYDNEINNSPIEPCYMVKHLDTFLC